MPPETEILVVEDEPALRRFLELLLQRSGYAVRVAGDGVEALERVEERVPDLVLLDLMLPRMDGFEVCRRLRARQRTARVPILVLTARATEEARRRSLEAGADEFIVKPYNPHDLLERIGRRVGRAAG
jgi:two-component system phosphate regulon response regulator PhoB